MKKPVYLDYNGTTPLDPEVIEAMRPFLEEVFGNPSSSHWYGIAAKQALELARQQVAALLNCDQQDIIFTSGGTESNNSAIKGVAWAYRDRGNHIITTQIEHPAVLGVCGFLEDEGFEVTYLPVGADGLVRVADVAAAITPKTILITVMYANNEVGTIQPVEEISRLAKKQGVLLHTDAAQSVGKIPVHVDELGVDLLSIAGHKVYAPKGVGALFVRQGVCLRQLLHGAGQEKGRRPGTENMLEIVGLGQACAVARRDMESNAERTRSTRDRLEQIITKGCQPVRLNGDPMRRLPNTSSLSFKDLEANRILETVGLEVAASAGAACHSDGVEISHVLRAMGIPSDWGKGTLRFSTGKMTTHDEIDKAASVVVTAVNGLRKNQKT